MSVAGGSLSILTRLGAPFQNLFKNPVIKDAIRTTQKRTLKLPTVSAGTKATIATVGTTAGIFGTSYLFTQTPGGLQTTSDITGATNNVTKFFSQNPLLLVGLIALGIIIVVKK